MKRIILFSLIITLPINILGIIWANNTKSTYYLLEKFDLTLAKGTKLKRIGTSEFYDLKNAVKAILGVERKSDVNLILPNKGMNKLTYNLPISGNNYQKDALLILDNKAIKGKVKLRGDHYYHWGFTRKSWRFKTSKKDIHRGINKFNLIIPKSVGMLLNHMSYKLAKSMGLLAADSRLVDFSVNGRYKGPRLLTEQIDESFLRKNRRMPNDIYKGDNIGQNKYIGVDVLLFENASIWEKASYNNHYEQNNLLPLETMLDGIKQGTYKTLDLHDFAAMAAYIDLTGSYHHDRTHNWILLYDNYTEKMSPIIWDSIGWLNYNVKLENFNIATSELLMSLYLNYDFIRLKNKIVNRFFQIQEKPFYKLLEKGIKRSKQIIQKNHHSFELSRTLIDEESAIQEVDFFETNVYNRLLMVKEYFLGSINKNDYKYSINNNIRLSVSGSKIVNAVHIKLNNNGLSSNFKTLLSYKQANQIVTVDITDNITVTNNDNNRLSLNIVNIGLLANTMVVRSYKGTNKIAFHQATYDIELVGVNPKDIQSVTLSFDNLTEETLELERVEHIKQIAFDEKLNNIIAKPEITEVITWSGEKHFEGFTTIEENIIIEKGTKLIFDEAATLKVLGKITAIGTVDEPIVFEALDSSKPWGSFALKDERANGSVFKHVIFKDGSGDKGDLYEYTAMLSIHNVQDVLVQDTEFYDSKLTDDTVHVIYSDVVFRNSKFVRSLSDALDADISTIIVDNCEFINSGNDAIDLMTSDAIVINTRFSHSADKGISIGEGSNLLAINNLIENNEIGMQSKDTSKAYIYNTSFIGNKIAIDAYHKNWRYSEGGRITVDNCIMQDNIENATVGKKSKVVINNCQIDTIDNFKAKDLRKGKIVVSEGESMQADFESPFFQNHGDLIDTNIDTRTQGFYEVLQ